MGWKWILPVIGNGACLDNSAAGHIYEDPSQGQLLNDAHSYIVDNWWYFQPFYSLPFQETVGVGAGSYRVCITNYEELKLFLLSPESLLLYSSSEVDIASMATLFNISIYIFTYNVQAKDIYGNKSLYLDMIS